MEVSVTGMFTEPQNAEKACTASVFAFLHNLPATVSIYADAGKLLVFGAPLTSGSLSKNEFFDRLSSVGSPPNTAFFFVYPVKAAVCLTFFVEYGINMLIV